MARTRTLTELLADLDFLADAQNLSARHDSNNKTRQLNQSIQRFREKVSVEGLAHFLQPFEMALPVGATDPYPFAVLDLDAIAPNVVRVYQIHLSYNNRVIPLEGIEFTEITRYQDDFSGIREAIPMAFASIGTAKLAIVPPPKSPYQVVVWYLPVLADLVDPGDTFDGVAGWEQWVIYDAAIQLANRDRDGTQLTLLATERDRIWRDCIKGAGRVNRASTIRRRDTWAERRARLDYARRRLP